MHLISSRTDEKHKRYEIHEFFGDNIPKYAILSHTWGEGEVTFQDIQHLTERVKTKQGFKKIAYTCDQAERDGLSWAWVDTCCIDKSSSAELSEAINSMYGWYDDSATCYAYLVDVPVGDDPFAKKSAFRWSRWFTRGWTLQELIAPREVKFYDEEWGTIGTKGGTKGITALTYPPGDEQEQQKDLGKLLGGITGIPEDCLVGHRSPSWYSVAKRMSWASKRRCTRVEDFAYCLMGIFGVNMPLLYGEGERAFIRLQEEIMKDIDDHSLFAWTLPMGDNQGWSSHSVFAHSPAEFSRSGNIIPVREELGDPSVVTRRGLKINLKLQPAETSHQHRRNCMSEAFCAILNCAREQDTTRRIAMVLIPEISVGTDQQLSFYRCGMTEHVIATNYSESGTFHTIYIHKNLPPNILYFSPSPLLSRQRRLERAYSRVNSVQRMRHLAIKFLSLRKYGEAQGLYYQIQHRVEQEFGGSHPSTLMCFDDLGLVMQGLGEYETAETYHRITLEAREIVLGKDDPDTLMSLENLALALQGLRKYEKAEMLHRQVLEGREKVLGKDHWDTLTSLSNMALVLSDLGKPEEAETFHRRALEGREVVLGRFHPDTLTSLANLVLTVRALGRRERLEGLFDWTQIAEDLGREHPNTQTSLRDLVLALRDLRNDEEAEANRARELLSPDTMETHAQGSASDLATKSQDPHQTTATASKLDRMSHIAQTTQEGRTLWTPQIPKVSRIAFGIGGCIQSRVQIRSEDAWVSCMEDFAAFIRTVPFKSARPIKIAVLDYGFDDALDIHDDNIAWIKSFSPVQSQTDMMNKYFSRPSGKHWRRISALISHICPKSRLYIALLEESSNSESNGKIHPTKESTAKAIRWALECGVDVICLSGIIDKDPDVYWPPEVRNAFHRAELAKVLVLHSPFDYRDTSSSGSRFTCAAMGGRTGPGIPIRKADLEFPAQRITFINSEEMTESYESDDAVAIAAASGLAGVLLYCYKLVSEHEPSSYLKRVSYALRILVNEPGVFKVRDFFGRKFEDLLLSSRAGEPGETSVTISEQTWNATSKKALYLLMESLIPDGSGLEEYEVESLNVTRFEGVTLTHRR
ncbi:hypothetical protein NUW58_g257 [Xylaria curta]|uniref:Uncharacterized protein n=2 Tax=Xylaria curta TaxID=42375 RepID=A0ACC1PQW3_9PEZI|nr:hypothetical protein NUW58_g4192 [Xylaria curta]KAJ2998648.1 hypothetical protein NUW58_g257 [Xylaria curta]